MTAYDIKVLIKGETEFTCKADKTAIQTLKKNIRNGLRYANIRPFEVRVKRCTKKKKLNDSQKNT